MKKAVEIKQGDQDKEEYLHCRDNAISTIGKIIKYHATEDNAADFLDLFLFWLSNMPLQLDTEECKEMNEFLAEQLVAHPQVVLGSNNERLPFIVELLGEQLHENFMHKDTIIQFGQILVELDKDKKAKTVLQKAKNKLSNLQKKRLDNAVKKTKKSKK